MANMVKENAIKAGRQEKIKNGCLILSSNQTVIVGNP